MKTTQLNKIREDQNHSAAAGSVGVGSYLADSRPGSIAQAKRAGAEDPFADYANDTSPGIVQRVRVEIAKPGNANSQAIQAADSPAPVQAVTVSVAKQGTGISEELLKTAMTAMQKIVSDAETGSKKPEKEEGKEDVEMEEGSEYQRLKSILAKDTVKEKMPKSSNSTYGLGGSNYFGTPSSAFTTTQGTDAFSEAVDATPESGTVKHLGYRKTGKHDEMHHISEYPGLQALASTQGHCFFCFGTIHGRGYQHGELRKDPWPQEWTHDYLKFKLKQASKKSWDKIGYANYPVIEIQSDTQGTRYYYVLGA